jgi:RNA recognition motif-containing protein
MGRKNNNSKKGGSDTAPEVADQVATPEPAGDANKKKEGGKRNDACCVFVGNVAFTTTWQKLKDVMRKAGDIDLVELVVDSSHKPKGSALVSFKNEDDAKQAVATLNGTVVDGREILVRSFERGARPLVIYGNYTRDQLNRVMKPGQFAPGQGAAPQQQQHHQGAHHQQQHHQGGHHQQQQQQHPNVGNDRVSLRPPYNNQHAPGHGTQQLPPQQGGRQEWKVHDGGDFNKRNRDTFGDDAVSYKPSGNGMPPSIPQPASVSGERKKLFVSNLPFSCTWKLLKDTFTQVGRVLRADIIMDERGRSRGMGTVVFATTEEAVKAIEEFDGIEMDGRPMGVRLDRDYVGPHQ